MRIRFESWVGINGYGSSTCRWFLVGILLVLLSWTQSCSSRPDPKVMKFWQEIEEETEAGCTDAQLAAFAAEAEVVSASVESQRDKFLAYLRVLDACDGGGTVDGADRVRTKVIEKVLPLLEGHRDNWSTLMIGLGHPGRGVDKVAARKAHEQNLRHLDYLEGISDSPFVRAVCMHRRVRLMLLRDRYIEALDQDEVKQALAWVDALLTRRGDLDGYWDSFVDSMTRSARANFTRIRENKAAPETVGVDFSDQAFSLADYRGKVVVLKFWASW